YKVIGRFDEPTDFYYTDANGAVKEVARPINQGIAQGETWLGDYIFADINNDGKIDNNDQTFIGNPEPKFTYGIGNTFSWKGFDLTIFLSGSYGNDVLNYNRRWLEQSGANSNLLKSTGYAIVEKIDPNGPDDFRNFHVTGGDPLSPRLYTASAKNFNWRVSDRYIEDGSYLRIQNISLGYTFPKKWLGKTPIQNLKVYANLQNVYTWTKYKGYDPEVGSLWGNTLYNGIDYGRYPSPRIYTFGLTASF
ncbi:TonB-dependent receptor, partial [Bacteroides uniformis]